MKYLIEIKPFGLSRSEMILLEKEHGMHFTTKAKKRNIFLNQHQKLNNEDITLLEELIHTKLPPQYKNFLKDYNGGKPCLSILPSGRVINVFFGFYNNPNVDCSIEWNLKMYQKRYPKTMLPIACAGDGDLILLGIAGSYKSKVYYWDHTIEKENNCIDLYKNIQFIAEDLHAFFHLLQSKKEA